MDTETRIIIINGVLDTLNQLANHWGKQPEPAAPAAQPEPAAPIEPAAPAAQPEPAPAAPVTQLDTEGLPWDARINTTTRGQTAKGVWKRKPGLSDDIYEQVKMELRSNITTPATQAQVDAAGLSEINMTWAQLVNTINAELINPLDVQNACVKHGVANITDLQNQPMLIPAVAIELGLNK